MTHTRLVRNMTIGGAAAAALTLLAATPASAETTVPEPDRFTSAFTVMATPDQVLNADGVATPGEPGATGRFDLRLDSASNTICYDITLTGVTGEYQSPAKTATHIHQAAVGKAGPPRIAFPNPVDAGDGTRTSSGCMQGPFTTGIMNAQNQDTGTGFTVAQIEADPASFAADTHTASFTAGAVRGQLTQVPVGGVDTGAGGSATTTSALPLVAGGGAVALAAAGVVLMRRHRAQES
ncbi:CHRD domain-containing protein [Clavibacter sp. VKM Ac-2542]|uniref:CHRD domain-containing protein n=1 Tax=Clavibacter sp. VKM Ac-2542 TaxID=2783811 RepID=UPI00188C573D|nr:CHRD domain-containing protein [Clavibacter sp. VKM Ac-2542]MBF4621494.1 CHRD domain-containing protein [Clavibacter sp. VKM Ac-2542]